MTTGIEVKTGFFPLAFFLYFVTPVIEIDGKKNKQKWGTSIFELDPGEHTIKIYFPYMGKSECGANQIIVKVAAGETKKVNYNMPPWMMAKGSLKEL